MATEKPIIVIVHGAFHLPPYYQRLIGPLRQQGYTVLAPALPSTGSDDSINGKTYVDDVRRIHESLLPLLDGGRTAVVVGHSQGGIAASAVTEGQTVEARNYRGLPGGITAVLYVAAFALPAKGMSLIDTIGGPQALETGPYYLEVRCSSSRRPFPMNASCPSLDLLTDRSPKATTMYAATTQAMRSTICCPKPREPRHRAGWCTKATQAKTPPFTSWLAT